MAGTESLRRFNRTWSRRIGLLDESYLGQGRSLGASRLLFEIGPDGRSVRELRRRLGMDSGYLSRLLRGLEDDDLVRVAADPADGRRRVVTPTPRGRRALARLEERSEAQALALVDGLSAGQRERLAAALATAERLLRAGAVRIEPADAGSEEAREVVGRYFGDIGARFTEPLDVTSYAASDAEEMTPPAGCFLLARADGLVVGCGGLRRHTATVGEVKRMWVDPDWRGLGLATRLLHALEDQARHTGYREMYLDTHVSLVEAQAMYRALGYRAIDRYNDNPHAGHWFAKSL